MTATATSVHSGARRPPSVRGATLAGLVALATVVAARATEAACDPTICVGSATACTISGTNTVDDNCSLDWHTKDVTLASGAILRTAADGQNFAIATDDFDVIGTIQDRGRGNAPLSVVSNGFFKLHSTGKIDVDNSGWASVRAAGYVQLDGTVTADGGAGGSDGGDVTFASTFSTLSTTGSIHANGGTGGSGGLVTLEADLGSVTIGGAVAANGGSGAVWAGTISVISAGTTAVSGALTADGGINTNGGEVDLTSVDDVTITAIVSANGSGTSAYGGTITIASSGDFLTTKRLQALGSGDGDGGTIDVTAAGSAEFDDLVRANGGSAGGIGGAIEVTAASVLIKSDWIANSGSASSGGTVDITAETGTVELQSTGSLTTAGIDGGNGGAITITAAGTITQSGVVSSTGGGGGAGGFVTIAGDGNVTSGANINATGSGTGSIGGLIDVSGGTKHTVSITKVLDARSTSTAGAIDGDVLVQACNVSIGSTGALKTRNVSVGYGRNFITYKGAFSIAGAVLADDPAASSCTGTNSGNTVRCRCVDTSPADGTCDPPARCVSSPIVAIGATITPTALVCPTALPACG